MLRVHCFVLILFAAWVIAWCCSLILCFALVLWLMIWVFGLIDLLLCMVRFRYPCGFCCLVTVNLVPGLFISLVYVVGCFAVGCIVLSVLVCCLFANGCFGVG